MSFRKVFSEQQNPLKDPLVASVFEQARKMSLKVYVVGGYLRDLLLKSGAERSSLESTRKADKVLAGHARAGSHRATYAKDIDFAVVPRPDLFPGTADGNTSAFAVAHMVKRYFKSSHFVPLDRDNDTARVVLDNGTILDFAGCVGGSIETDINRRDFTINALAWDAEHPDCVIDRVGALKDIDNRIIRAISKQVLKDDPLRILRAFRFKALLQAEIEQSTLEWVKSEAASITQVAYERINYEMFTLLQCNGAGSVLEEMSERGPGGLSLLECIYPELKATRDVTPNAFHHLGLFDHSLAAVKELERKLPQLPQWAHESYLKDLSQGVSRLAATKLAALLHDIGKPATWQITEEGRHTFFGHDVLGAEMVETVAERMKWSRQLNRFISKLIRWHLRPGQLFHGGPPPSDKTVMRFYRKMNEETPELMLLAFGDLGATLGAGLKEVSRMNLSDQFDQLLAGYSEFTKRKKGQPKYLTGVDVMRLLKISPGPEVGEILNALVEAQGLKEVTDRWSAERFVQDYQHKKYSR